MLVEITSVEIRKETKEVIVEAVNLERVVEFDNLFEDIEPEQLTYCFAGNDRFAMDALRTATEKVFQCNDGKTFGDKVLLLKGAHTCWLPNKYIVEQASPAAPKAKAKK